MEDHELSLLVIMAHSQGTIIAVDEIAKSWSEKALPPVTLVTFGSPVTELYQHYFPLVYPPWSDDEWDTLFTRITRWGNFYRVDDYVGRRITPPTGLCDFFEAAVGRGGHTNYWRDPRFLDALNTWGLFVVPEQAHRAPAGTSVRVGGPEEVAATG